MTASHPVAAALVDRYDAVLFDLDGVVYLGPAPVPGAPEGLADLRDRGTKLGFVTNNAARPPGAVADHLRELGVQATEQDVVTSSQAAARLLLDRFGAGAKVLIVGGAGIIAALDEVGLVGVRSADDEPVAVIQGFSFDLTWDQLNEAAIAIQRGAHWVATNTDSTRPTDRGTVPGNGAAVAAVGMAVDVQPEVAGKPGRPLLDTSIDRLGATRPIFVGDRIDTDIAAASSAGVDSLFVLSGASGPQELVDAGVGQRPTHLGADLRALLRPERVVHQVGDSAVCGAMSAATSGEEIVVDRIPGDVDEALDALWAVAWRAWRAADEGSPLESVSVLAEITSALAAPESVTGRAR